MQVTKLALKIVFYVPLNGLKSFIDNVYREKNILMKKLFEEISVTHEESSYYSQQQQKI